jgi:hypothetical protein
MPVDLRQFIEKPKEDGRRIPPYSPPQTPKENFREQETENAEEPRGEILHQWQAPEFEVYEKSNRWYLLAGAFLLAIITYAMFTNGPIMAITFILIGIVGYIHLQKEPRLVTFTITNEGIIADKDMYLFENIHSFWVFYEPHHMELISLHTKAAMLPFVHIPLENEDPVHLREMLLPFIPEIKQEPSFVDTLERILHI